MENRILDHSQAQEGAMARTFLSSVFSWMFLALTITGIIAYWLGSNEQLLLSLLLNAETGGMSMLGYAIIFAPLAFSLIIGFTLHRLPWAAILVIFLLFAGVMGISLSTIFLVYSLGSIYLTFAICAGMYGVMAVVGYVTKTDLSRLGPILMMGVIGIVIASIVNVFVGGETLSHIIGFLGVIVFTAMTAYKVQELKRIGSGLEYAGAEANKLALLGALSLYITFINLFLSLLRLFGERK